MDRLKPKIVTVFGGSGFLGTQVVQALANHGHRIRVAVRRPDLAGHLRMSGMVGQVQPIQANIRNLPSIQRAIAGSNIVINLVGVSAAKGVQSFDSVHIDGAAHIAQVAQAAGVDTLVHISALGIEPAAAVSAYARTKLAGETATLAAYPQAVILRPSILFGQGDRYFNVMASLARFLPILPIIGSDTRFQPVYVGDVAEAVVRAARNEVETGRIYELGGPQVETQRELYERIKRETLRQRPLLPLPAALAKLVALPLSLLPGQLLTPDKVERLCVDNVVSPEAIKNKHSFAAFNITPTAMGTILPTYLYRFRKHGQFDRDIVPNKQDSITR